MSALLSRIMLAIFMLPLAALIYTGAFFLGMEHLRRVVGYDQSNDEQTFLFSGAVAALFVAIYWWLLWRKSVAWTQRRLQMTFIAAASSVMLGVLCGWPFVVMMSYAGFGYFLGSALAPIFWLVCTAFIWRDTPEERRARVGSNSALVCPTCGYNLTGLSSTRCPECGTHFTLDELLATQPAKVDAELGA